MVLPLGFADEQEENLPEAARHLSTQVRAGVSGMGSAEVGVDGGFHISVQPPPHHGSSKTMSSISGPRALLLAAGTMIIQQLAVQFPDLRMRVASILMQASLLACDH